ncbi:thermonuclease family protein [Qipengyuania profunda]|jgi:micrococcal nuclease|uniref:thermonuclease family protein n=1 Tax=Qipengyuania profunda TaxID=3113984 RepID=UPI002A187552|nr:thermonuclease family protein [Qipengyuania sp. HL-TH1]WPL57891.1 thermonuclease family protein [Qipengyuania sp. HL-TH5]
MLLIAAALAVCAPGPRDHCVHDGDTVWLEGEKIRIADIDTPELNGACEYERALALRARNRLIQLLNAGAFEIARTGQDRYGRTLATLHRSGRSIGAQLVAEGLARTWSGRREPWCPGG